MKGDQLYLMDILDCIKRVEEYTQVGREAFMGSHLLQDGVTPNLEIISEAANRIYEYYLGNR